MAEFLDSGTPGFVYAPGGHLVDRSTLGPTDTVVSGSHAAPAATPAGAPAITPPTGAAPMTARDVMAKRDQVLGPMVTTGSSTTTQTTPGISSTVLNPILEGNTARAEQQAAGIRRSGEESASRKEEMAGRDMYLAQGRQATAEADREDAAQRAQIARQNELALSLQKDPAIDPDRFVKNMSTGTKIATTILAALNGGFKGMVGQSGNDVMDILSKRVQEDIASQKEQLASGRVRRGNLVAYFQNAGLREDAAVRAAEATSWAMLDRMAAAERERIGAGQDRTTADVLAEQLKAKAAEQNDNLKLSLGQDRTTTSTTTQRQRMTPAGEGDQLAQFQKQLAARKAFEEAGATPDELAMFDKTFGVPSPTGESETARKRREDGEKGAQGKDLSEAQGKAQAAASAISNFGEKAGLVRNPKTGKWETGDGIVPPALLEKVNPLSDNAINASFEAAVEAYGRMQSGGVIGADERPAFREQLGGSTMTRRELAARLNAAEVTLEGRQAERAKEQKTAPAGWK